jgi:hypothetical protein
MQREGGALLFGKGRAFVEPGIMKQLETVKMGTDHFAARVISRVFFTHFSLLQIPNIKSTCPQSLHFSTR